MEDQDYSEILHGVPKTDYGDCHASHIIEVYKMYVEMADQISSRRQSTNSFFLTLNTGVFTFIGYMMLNLKAGAGSSLLVMACFIGASLGYLWYRIIKSYRGLNSAKFDVIHHIETYLPLRPYTSEWVRLEKGKNPAIYSPFTKIEKSVPWVFIAAYALVAAYLLVV